MAPDERDAEFLERLAELFATNDDPVLSAADELRRIKHYGVYDEMYEFVMSAKGVRPCDVLFERIFAFRRKPDRVVWTEEELRDKVRDGVVSEYDVIEMADGFVPPQCMFAVDLRSRF